MEALNQIAAPQARVFRGVQLADLGTYAYFFQPAFTKTDISLSYHAPDDRFFVSAYARNLEDSIVVTQATAGTFGVANFGDPRQFGVRVGTKF